MDKDIWKPETGILDLPDDWSDLRVPELANVREIWRSERERLKETEQLHQFTEQLNREWAIETGVIENLYEIERGVTQTLIEQGFQSALLEFGSTNKPRDYVIQLLKDQKDALEGLFDFIKQSRSLTTSYIKELHAALLRNQTYVEGIDSFGNLTKVSLIRGDWKKLPNHPTRDDITYYYCPPEQVASEMDRLISMHRQHLDKRVPPEVEAAWLHHRFSQIHPFQDGNGPVPRTIASLVFIQQELFPLIVTRDDKVDYINALEEADSGSLKPLIALFARLQRIRFRSVNALSSPMLIQRGGVDQALAGLRASIARKAEEQKAILEKVFQYSSRLEAQTLKRLNELSVELQEVLRQLDTTSYVSVDQSTTETEHFFRGQIVFIAKEYLNYYADTRAYRRWIRLKMKWTRRANLVFTFHSIGFAFSGVLVCAPFLEFRDDEDDNEPHATLTNVAEEPFEFFYNEDIHNIEKRFDVWLETVLTIALAELQSNL